MCVCVCVTCGEFISRYTLDIEIHVFVCVCVCACVCVCVGELHGALFDTRVRHAKARGMALETYAI